jgi:hypothetical protein
VFLRFGRLRSRFIKVNRFPKRCFFAQFRWFFIALGWPDLAVYLVGPSARDGLTCDTAHGRLAVIHRAAQRSVDKPVDIAVDKTVNNVMVSLRTSARDGPLLASWSVIPCASRGPLIRWAATISDPAPSPVDPWSNEKVRLRISGPAPTPVRQCVQLTLNHLRHKQVVVHQLINAG